MPTVTVYPSGTSAGTPAGSFHKPDAKRGEVAGWSRESARRHAAFLRSVDHEAVEGHLYSFTLTVRDTPATAAEWAALRNAWLTRIRTRRPPRDAACSGTDATTSAAGSEEGPRLLAYHWVTEVQRRGAPHTHGALLWSQPLSPRWREWLKMTWCEVAAEFGALRIAQDLSDTLNAVGWAKYVAKHSARSAGHAQRSQMPPGWKASGRLWGASRTGWPTRVERFELDQAAGYQFRRLVRSWRLADARKEKDPQTRRRRIASARRMLRAPAGWAGRLRGVSEWVPEGTTVEMLRWLALEGHDVQYVPDQDPPAAEAA